MSFSSDSDAEDKRLAEAAVSGHHILGASAIGAPPTHNPAEDVSATQENVNSRDDVRSGNPVKAKPGPGNHCRKYRSGLRVSTEEEDDCM